VSKGRPVPSAELLAKEEQALDLRRSGESYSAIAAQLGYSDRSAASKAVHRGIGRTLQESADRLVTLESDRLDRLLHGVWDKAIAGDLAAVDRVLKIMERRAKLLGLDRTAEVSAEIVAMQVLVQARQLQAFETAMLAILADFRIDPTKPESRAIIARGFAEAAKAGDPMEEV
jgi:hypothetical protein